MALSGVDQYSFARRCQRDVTKVAADVRIVSGGVVGARVSYDPFLVELLSRSARPLRAAVVGIGTPVVATSIAVASGDGHTTSAALLYVVAVIVAATFAGRGAGLMTAILSFLGLNFFFTEPLHTFRVNRVEDVVALFVFLGAAVFVAAILSIAIEQRGRARRQEAEAVSLQELGSRLLAGDELGEVVGAFTHQAVAVLGAAGCAVELSTNVGPITATSGTSQNGDETTSVVGVYAGGRDVGRITLIHPSGTAMEGRTRVIRAFATQLGLALERAHLASEADSARVDAETSSLRAALFSSVTHDLRTPLASITASVTNLLDTEARMTEDDRVDQLQTIKQEAQRLNRLVGNLLHLARVRAGAAEAVKVSASINDVIEGTVGRLQSLLESRTVRLFLREHVPEVAMDIDQMDQVMTNLLENAARHAPAGSEITVSSARWRDALEIRVSDHGPGVPPDERERVFEPFVRSETGREGGAGLGLSIARAIVENHGGKIWIEGGPGGGAVVVFRIPDGAH